MSYDEIEIEDMSWNEALQAFTYPCPCGDLFQITMVGSRLEADVESARLVALGCWSSDGYCMGHGDTAASSHDPKGGAESRRGYCQVPKLLSVHHGCVRSGELEELHPALWEGGPLAPVPMHPSIHGSLPIPATNVIYFWSPAWGGGHFLGPLAPEIFLKL